MRKLKLWKNAALFIAAAIVVTACAGGNGGNDTGGATPPAVQEDGTGSSAGPDTTPSTPAPTEGGAEAEPAPEPGEAPAKAEDLPQETNLEFTVEGEPQSVPATLTKSELGYAFYLMEGFEFTPEEPGKDVVFHNDFPEFFLRIEPLPADTDLDALRATAEEALKAVGDVHDTQESFFDETIRSKAKFILLGSSAEASVTVIALESGGQLFRLTLHFPSAEAAEGVTPRFFPMIRTIVPIQ
ncbi:hypothetical protein MO973_39630 [Paenibacillus sp. TRM 82003]|nr:hypothetical protein [Paenibacillus sp. TRM 82003]